MKTTMLEYSKLVLEKVSFNRMIFWKEYKKFNKILPDNYRNELRNWVRSYKSI